MPETGLAFVRCATDSPAPIRPDGYLRMTDKSLVFLRRFGSTALMWTLALWTIFSGYEPGFFVMLTLLAMVGLWEYYTMLDHKRLPNFKIIGMICGVVMSAGSFFFMSRWGVTHAQDFELLALIGCVLVVFARQMFQKTRDLSPLETMAYTLFGLFYVPWMFLFVSKIVYILPRDAAGHVTGHLYVLWLLVVTKFSDMGAYLTGSVIGKHPLVPHISPKKTWEGFFGALAFSTAGACGLVWLKPDWFSFFTQRDAVILGLGLGFAAVIGDLAESIVKRSADVKDSGSLLPGIGGALDLIDSILFTAPLLYFYLRFVLGLS